MDTQVATNQLEQHITALFSKKGPDHEDFEKVLALVDQIPPDEIDDFRNLMKPILNPGTIIGFSFTKPFGYNGDFFIIEKIYQRYISPDPEYRKWDAFFHRLPAAVAVVNRKKLAIEILSQLHLKSQTKNAKVLILGSGPVSEVHEFFGRYPSAKINFDLIDLDQRAIAYASNKNKAHLGQMTFYNRNVIRYEPETTYDLIWSAGLFDYFKDKHFVYLLKKFYRFVSPGGEMIIGNFNIENPSRRIMEALGDWFLYHRSEDELLRFAHQADIDPQNVKVISEPLGINLFLRVKKPG
jgi:extracellular factor (EF) 3-hydroxypalmitic acid methyl ester biosynthesis protein